MLFVKKYWHTKERLERHFTDNDMKKVCNGMSLKSGLR